MTKEITKAIILQELQDKFKLRDFDPAKFLFDETVVPTYDIGQHLAKLGVEDKIMSIASTGNTVFFTVPQNEKWTLHGYNVIFMTGVYTIAGVYLLVPALAEYFYLDLTAAQNTSYQHFLKHPVTLDSGDGIATNVDGYTSTGNLMIRVLVTKEEIR